jgi:tetratricopeptide (TPR) repeat protein
MDSSAWQVFAVGGLILLFAITPYLVRRRAQKIKAGLINPRPRLFLAGLYGISRQDRQQTATFVMIQVNDLNQLPWGENPVPDRREAERIYQGALDAIADAEGDYRKLTPVIDDLLKLPIDLALSGVARTILTLSYLQGGLYSPIGIQAALMYTSAAVNLDPLSVDAWIMRLYVATSAGDIRYGLIAKAALKQARALNPNHPRLPDAESSYYKRYGNKQQQEVAIRRMIDLAPSPVARRAGYDRLAKYYETYGRLDDTLATYQEYFRQYPQGSAWTWHNYSIGLMQAKRYQEALDASNRALVFFEFSNARDINNEARKQLGMPPVEPLIEVEG